MKIFKIALMYFAAYGLILSYAHAAGDADRGRVLFNAPQFAGAASGKSCNSCHPAGRGLERSGDKKEFKIMGKTQNSLEDVVNVCIEQALKGKPLDPSSKEMQDIVSYIRSLKVPIE